MTLSALTYGQLTTLVGGLAAILLGGALGAIDLVERQQPNSYAIGLVTLGLGAFLGNTGNNSLSKQPSPPPSP